MGRQRNIASLHSKNLLANLDTPSWNLAFCWHEITQMKDTGVFSPILRILLNYGQVSMFSVAQPDLVYPAHLQHDMGAWCVARRVALRVRGVCVACVCSYSTAVRSSGFSRTSRTAPSRTPAPASY